jgi:hypothetical protein
LLPGSGAFVGDSADADVAPSASTTAHVAAKIDTYRERLELGFTGGTSVS